MDHGADHLREFFLAPMPGGLNSLPSTFLPKDREHRGRNIHALLKLYDESTYIFHYGNPKFGKVSLDDTSAFGALFCFVSEGMLKGAFAPSIDPTITQKFENVLQATRAVMDFFEQSYPSSPVLEGLREFGFGLEAALEKSGLAPLRAQQQKDALKTADIIPFPRSLRVVSSEAPQPL